MSETHKHQHVLATARAAKTIDEAIFKAEMTDPQAHDSGLVFNSFEVLTIKDRITHKPGDYVTPERIIEVVTQAPAEHIGWRPPPDNSLGYLRNLSGQFPRNVRLSLYAYSVCRHRSIFVPK